MKEEGWRDGESAGMERHKGETAHLCILQSLRPSVPLSLCLRRLCAICFAIDELARPHLKIDQRPESLGMIARARLMFGDQVADKGRIEDAPVSSSRAERVIVNHRA